MLQHYECFVTSNKLQIVAENVDSTLIDFVKKNTPLPETQILQLFLEVCSALQSVRLHTDIDYHF